MARAPSLSAPALVGGLCFCALALITGSTHAFCRSTTCDVDKDPSRCAPVDGCPTKGLPLVWPDTCVGFAIHELGSPRRGISAEQAELATQRAFASWISVDCGGGKTPSIGIVPLGTLECGEITFNPPDAGRAGAPNANVIRFRDDGWPYVDERFTLAKTTLTFDTETGYIFDADIELNSVSAELTLDDEVVSHDLEAILAHEVGHFLGLSHSSDPYATMNAQYSPADIGFRTLSADDRAGICDVYPPGDFVAGTCPPGSGPPHGFARECSSHEWAESGLCSVRAGTKDGSGAPLFLSLLLLALVRRRGTPGVAHSPLYERRAPEQELAFVNPAREPRRTPAPPAAADAADPIGAPSCKA